MLWREVELQLRVGANPIPEFPGIVRGSTTFISWYVRNRLKKKEKEWTGKINPLIV